MNNQEDLEPLLKLAEPEALREYVAAYAAKDKKFCMELRSWLQNLYPEDDWTDNEYRRMVKAVFANRKWKNIGCDDDFSDGWETVNWKKVHKELWKLLKWATKRWTVYKAEVIAPIVLQFYKEAYAHAEEFMMDDDSCLLSELDDKMAALLLDILHDQGVDAVYKDEIVQEILIMDAHNDYLAYLLQGFAELKEYVER